MKSPHPPAPSPNAGRGEKNRSNNQTRSPIGSPSPSIGRGAGGEGRFPAYTAQAWYLAAEMTCWPGLMPHIHGVEILDTHENRTLARINARWGWMPITFECGFVHDESGLVMQRWYRGRLFGGIVERWRVRDAGAGVVQLSFAIHARGWRKRLLTRVVVAPIAWRQFRMIELLAVAHQRSHERDGW